MVYIKICRSLFFLVIFCIFYFVTFSQERNRNENGQDGTELLIKMIRKEYYRINADSSRMKMVTREAPGESPESGELRKFYEKDTLRKAVKTLFFETGKQIDEYYFKDGQLFFSYEANVSYDKPISVEGSKVSRVEENRFYFSGHGLIRWLDKNGKIVADKKLYAAKEKKLLDDIKKFKTGRLSNK
jgi:hypothetical protein